MFGDSSPARGGARGASDSARRWSALRVLGLAAVAAVIAYVLGVVLNWSLLKLPVEAAAGAVAVVVAAVFGGLAWAVALVVTAVGTGLAAGAGAAAAGMSAGMVAGGLVGFVGLTFVTMRVGAPVVAAVEEHPFETIAPVLGVVSGFGTNSLAKAAGIESPLAEVLAAVNGALLVIGGIFVRREGFWAKVVGASSLVLVPAVIVVNVVGRRSPAEVWSELLALDGTVWLGFLLVLFTACITGAVALQTRDD